MYRLCGSIYIAYIDLYQVAVSAPKGGSGQELISLTKKLSSKKILLTKEKLVFSTGISLGRLTILKNRLMLSNTWPTQTQWYFNSFFCFILLSLGNFCLTELCVLQFLFWLMGFVFVCVCKFLVFFIFHCLIHIFYLFICLYQNREQKRGFEMVGGGEDGDELGEEKCNQNILYKILNFNRQKIHQVKKKRIFLHLY